MALATRCKRKKTLLQIAFDPLSGLGGSDLDDSCNAVSAQKVLTNCSMNKSSPFTYLEPDTSMHSSRSSERLVIRPRCGRVELQTGWTSQPISIQCWTSKLSAHPSVPFKRPYLLSFHDITQLHTSTHLASYESQRRSGSGSYHLMNSSFGFHSLPSQRMLQLFSFPSC